MDCLDHSPQVEILGRHLTQIPRRKERLADAAEHMAVHLGSSRAGSTRESAAGFCLNAVQQISS